MRDLYTINSDRGRGGSKIPKIRLTSFVHGPYYQCPFHHLSRNIMAVFGQQNVSLFSELSLGRAGSRCVLIQVYDDSTEIINSLYPLLLPEN